MKISIWDILSVVLILATVMVVMVAAQIFMDPTSGLNPFPPPTLPTALVLPKPTNTPIRLPPTWTPTTVNNATVEPLGVTPTGLKATSTLVATATGFVLPSATPTLTPSITPTITRTPSVTPTKSNTPVPFAVTSVQMGVDAAAVSTTCPPGHLFTFVASIVAGNGGTVMYHWEFSDGTKSAVQSLSYSSASSQAVTTTWNQGATFSGWAQIYIDEPNHQAFSRQAIALTCVP